MEVQERGVVRSECDQQRDGGRVERAKFKGELRRVEVSGIRRELVASTARID